ncbi:Nn.00g017020.m01.CDS01 [Neocucurbitaria sp. VM-36]
MGDQPETVPGGEELKFAEDFPGLEIPIYPVGDEAAFHTLNDPNDPYERDVLTQRFGRVNIRCEHKDIAHGYFSKDEDDLCSLIVVKFRFDPNGIAARLKEAHATIKFASSVPGQSDPQVISMYPDGSFVVAPTQQHEQTVKGGGLNVGGGAAGVQVGGDLRLEKTIDHDVVSYARVIGAIELHGDFGKDNAVSWKFFENPNDPLKTGIVSSLQAAILLKRTTMDVFRATIKIKVTADTVGRIGALFKKDSKDDDVFYNPRKVPTNRICKYDVDSLGAVDLKSLSEVTFRTLLRNAVKAE